MKMKYFFRGLGMGIIITALILCINYRASSSSNGDVVEEAKKLGMVFPEGTEQPISAMESATTSAIEGTSAPNPVQTSNSSGAGVTGSDAEKATKKPNITKKPVQSSADTTSFTVRDGLLSSSVARELMEAGIIKDRKAFDKYLEENDYAKMIREGTYKIPKGASYNVIARIITKQD